MKKIGLALSGGAAFGAAHIGVLKAFKEDGISINYISGTSIGAFVAALYAFNNNWEKIYDLTKKLNWFDVSALSLSQYGLLSNKKIGKLLSQTIGKKSFNKSAIPLSIVATDIANGEKVVMNSGSVTKSVMASTSIPGIFIPVEINNRLLVDGGIVENVPISPLNSMGANYIIAVDLLSKYVSKKPKNIFEIILNTFDFMIINNSKLEENKADIRIKPDLSSYSKIKTKHFDDLFEKGYLEAKKKLQDIRKKDADSKKSTSRI